MKKSNIAGWKDVFSFTFIQTIKNKAFIISFLITLVLSLVSIPFLNLIKGGGNTEDRISPVKKFMLKIKLLGSMDFKEVKITRSLAISALKQWKKLLKKFQVVLKKRKVTLLF